MYELRNKTYGRCFIAENI